MFVAPPAAEDLQRSTGTVNFVLRVEAWSILFFNGLLIYFSCPTSLEKAERGESVGNCLDNSPAGAVLMQTVGAVRSQFSCLREVVWLN